MRLDGSEYELRAGLLRAAIDEVGPEVSRFEARLRHAVTGLIPEALVEEVGACLARGSRR